MRRTRRHGISRRMTAMLLCMCMIVSMVGGIGIVPAIAAGPTKGIVSGTRVADPNTMDDYINRLLTDKDGSRYAGRVWTDKTVFAYGADVSKGGVDGNRIVLDMATDGYVGNVGFNADFAHVFSALASSQVINEYPPSPIDMVLVLDISSSMSDVTEPAAGSVWAKINSELNDYFTKNVNSLKENPEFMNYYKEETESDGNDDGDIIRFAREQAFEHTRFLNLIYSADRIIRELMNNNSENRVSVVVYDRRATVIMPLAHYTPNEKSLSQLDEGKVGVDTVYDIGYLKDDTTDPAAQIIHKNLKDMVFSYLCPFFNGHSNNGHHPTDYVDVSEAYVVATTNDLDEKGEKIETINVTDELRIAGTNTHAGLTAGLEQLANAKDTTFTAELSNGQMSTVPRIPAAVIMTDGGSNTVANGPWYDPDYATPVQRSDHKNDWSSIVVTQYLLTAAYLKSAVEKNYEAYMGLSGNQDLPVYTVGVDLRNDNDRWVPARLYPMLDPSKYFKAEGDIPKYAENPSSVTGEVALGADVENARLIDNAFTNIQNWFKDPNQTVTDQFPVRITSDDAGVGRFQQGEHSWAGDIYEYDPYIIPFEHDTVNLGEAALGKWTGSLGGITYNLRYNMKWHGFHITEGEEFNAHQDVSFEESEITGTATFWSFVEAVKTAADGPKYKAGEKEYSAEYLTPRTVEYDDTDDNSDTTKTRTVSEVTQDDMQSNLNYVTHFYDVSSSQLEDIFAEILNEVLGQVFVPISGDNDAGVGDSITYQDPIGEYMEIKNGSITATPYHTDGSMNGTAETDYDMAMLLFGETWLVCIEDMT